MDIKKKALGKQSTSKNTRGSLCVLAEKGKRGRKEGVKAQPLGRHKCKHTCVHFLLLYRSDPKGGGKWNKGKRTTQTNAKHKNTTKRERGKEGEKERRERGGR